MKKNLFSTMLTFGMILFAVGCSNKNNNQANNSNDTNASEKILVAAAASMQPSLEEINALFEAEYNWITVDGTYDSSGKLQTQIEEGMDADIFLSAAKTQMNALKDESLIDEDSIIELLENKVVLIVPQDVESKVTSFDDILNADKIAIGDPASVPAGQYAKEIFENLGIYSEVEAKASLGTNVTEVLNWVAEGSADAGVVYATDAATTDQVIVVADAPEGTLANPVIYPIGIVSASQKKDAANLYVEFLQSDEVKAIFEKYGFLAK